MINIKSPIWNSILHGVGTWIIFALPLLLTAYPKVGDITVSAIVVVLVKYLQKKLEK